MVALGAAGVGAVEGVLDVLGVGHGAAASHRARAARSSSPCARRAGLAGCTRSARAAAAARPQAGEHHADAEQEQQQRPAEQRLVDATPADDDEDDEVRDAEVGGPGRAVDRAVGDQPAAGGEQRRAPSRRAATSSPVAGRRGRRSPVRTPVSASASDRQPRGVDQLLGVPRRRGAQHSETRTRRARARPAASGRRRPSRVEGPVDEATAPRRRPRPPRSARRSPSFAPPRATARRPRARATSRRTRRPGSSSKSAPSTSASVSSAGASSARPATSSTDWNAYGAPPSGARLHRRGRRSRAGGEREDQQVDARSGACRGAGSPRAPRRP